MEYAFGDLLEKEYIDGRGVKQYFLLPTQKSKTIIMHGRVMFITLLVADRVHSPCFKTFHEHNQWHQKDFDLHW